MKTNEEVAKEVIAARGNKNAVWALRALCETYNEQELHEAKNHFNCTSDDPLGMVVLEAINRLRHAELNKRLKALEKPPHWTLTPTFWLVLATTLFTFAGVIMAYPGWKAQIESAPISSNLTSPPPLVIQLSPESKLILPESAPTNSVVEPVSPKK
jgi:hypothetical protein